MSEQKKYAKVAVDAPVYELFTYSIPKEYLETLGVGWRVMVPFGRRLATGFVVDLLEKPDIPEEKIKPIADIPDDEPIITPQLYQLCKFVANYYVAPLGETIASVLPGGIAMTTEQTISLISEPDPELLNKTQRRIINLLKEGSIKFADLAQKVGRRGLIYNLRKLERIGAIARRYIYRQKAPPRFVTIVGLAKDVDDELIKQIEPRAPKQAALLRYIATNGQQQIEKLRKLFGYSVVKALIDKGFITVSKREIFRRSDGWLQPRTGIEKLTKSQERAITEITRALSEGDHKPILIHGVTASGKTLVYLEAAKKVRAMGRGVLVLVPEVALTPQMWGAMREYFGEDVAVLHSYLSPGERSDAWRRIRRGDIMIALGARSAIFAPVKNLGLIIVDEEQDQSYKNGRPPYYNARDLAIVRGKIENALVILGSATPSMESYYNAITGKYKLIEMPERVPGSKLPKVIVVDMRRRKRDEWLFSNVAVESIKDHLARGEQVILMLNRRGYANNLRCVECGYIPRCPNCDLTLTYHRAGDLLKCHWCDYTTPAPDRCPECGSENFKYRGKGTQRIELTLYDFVEPERVFRVDSDAISRKGALNKILRDFSEKNGAILVGTQMVAKGHDFAGVTLVVVLDADVGLAIPDFRASERVFQLLTQVAGRAGRAEKPGIVIIQTRHPDSPTVKFAVEHDYKKFFAKTLPHRQMLLYPPFSRLIRIITTSKDHELAEQAIRKIHRWIVTSSVPGTIPLAPTKPPIPKLRGEYRWHLLVKTTQIKKLLPLLRAVAKAEFKNVKVRIDVDPYDMM